MPNEVKNVFISHIHEDDDGLAKLKSLVADRGLDVRDYSINSDKPNAAKDPSYIKSEILAPQIKACSVLVVYITRGTKASEYVNWEIEYAEKEGKRIVGVWAHGENGCEMPEALEKLADDIVGWHGASIVDAICGTASAWESQAGAPLPLRHIERYSCG